jgi:hypothetical protein
MQEGAALPLDPAAPGRTRLVEEWLVCWLWREAGASGELPRRDHIGGCGNVGWRGTPAKVAKAAKVPRFSSVSARFYFSSRC